MQSPVLRLKLMSVDFGEKVQIYIENPILGRKSEFLKEINQIQKILPIFEEYLSIATATSTTNGYSFLNQSSDNPQGQSFPLKMLKKADCLSKFTAKVG